MIFKQAKICFYDDEPPLTFENCDSVCVSVCVWERKGERERERERERDHFKSYRVTYDQPAMI